MDALAVIVLQILAISVVILLTFLIWFTNGLLKATVWFYEHAVRPGLQAIWRQLEAAVIEWSKPSRIQAATHRANREMTEATDQFIAETTKFLK